MKSMNNLVLLVSFLFLFSCTHLGPLSQKRGLSSVGAVSCKNPQEVYYPALLRSDFPGRMSLDEMRDHFQWIIDSYRRMEFRGYRNQKGDYTVALFRNNVTGATNSYGEVVIPKRVYKAIATHVNEALDKGYVSFPYFPDMGHGHLMLPGQIALKLFAMKSENQMQEDDFLEEVFNHPELEILYHAAEHLDYIQNGQAVEELEFFRRNRNIIGTIRNPKEIVTVDTGTLINTAGAPHDRQYLGMFYLSASREGCLKLNDEFYYDISITPFSYDPTLVSSDE